MYMMSSRENFWAGERLSNKDQIKDVVLDDPDPAVDSPLIEEAIFFDMMKDKRLLLLIHGYNNEADDVCRAYSIIQDNVHRYLKGNYDDIVGYTWPGGSEPLNYYKARRRAGAVAPRVARWLAELTKVTQAIDVMDHSMGTRVILSALRMDTTARLHNLYSMASAVEDESIQYSREYFSSTKACDSVYVFHSRHDKVLRFAFKGAEWDRALGYSGPEDPALIMTHSPNVKVINCRQVIDSHGGYKYSESVYRFIARELKSSEAPQYSILE
ncbi:conserved hypothetical protein [Nitrosococcus oceani ATCC 19707]|uniref:Alpha/beta hydrolase n=3 Tax=Nitrosococcus oceani TaxID=1229 RepID=Q3JA74_NITOC|nr:alpha/beta hydrolase [Nitrosococcus oceani]ABA58272.1 conserved hypothetical protein [Nitrosococcus oceani ATCC 19707]EDZ68110.1 conserved hypothetical protein [Nitrosococcus oceani AFC27]KFI19292.1 hypothetical protein IB75_09570 [Nitrosococcus oceani C-27]GEM18652.1 hypothetical protein NONS58_00080 [Nitrosococcus oceani]